MLVGVYRERVFSPGKVREDAEILEATLAELSRRQFKTSAVEAENLGRLSQRPTCVLNMAQSIQALRILEGWQKEGTRIINSVSSVRNSYRKPLISLLGDAQIPMPAGRVLRLEEAERRIPSTPVASYWIKRGDVHATRPEDVVKVRSRDEWVRAIGHFRRHEIGEILIQEDVEGEAVKFYGVGNGRYFTAFRSSSRDEITLQIEDLAILARRSAKAVGLEIYGGDAIVTEKGEVVLIDLNDWPSFSRCCQAAARSIVQYVADMYNL